MQNAVPLFARGYFSVPIPTALKQKIVKLNQLWQKFYKQPLSQKELHCFDSAGGYEYKPLGVTHDSKENFHLTLGYQAPQGSSEVDIAFILYGKEVIRELLAIVRSVATKTSSATGVEITNLVCEDIENWVMRFLHYFPRKESQNQFLAVSHVDKGVLTLHLTESEKGFEVLWNNEWKSVAGKHGYVHGYAGLCGQYHTQGNVSALCHRVVETQNSRHNGRTSIVLFVDAGDIRYDKANYGSAQARFPFGENYLIPFEEFKEFFVSKEEAVL